MSERTFGLSDFKLLWGKPARERMQLFSGSSQLMRNDSNATLYVLFSNMLKEDLVQSGLLVDFNKPLPSSLNLGGNFLTGLKWNPVNNSPVTNGVIRDACSTGMTSTSNISLTVNGDKTIALDNSEDLVYVVSSKNFNTITLKIRSTIDLEDFVGNIMTLDCNSIRLPKIGSDSIFGTGVLVSKRSSGMFVVPMQLEVKNNSIKIKIDLRSVKADETILTGLVLKDSTFVTLSPIPF